ncbi:MAG: hypothetical protein EBU84_02130 [Actinobacteria bacterium]|nr:hypothetical protein [Actinomycetota bacterium]
MRQVITLKFLVLALVIAVLGALLIWIYNNGDSGTIETENLRRIDKGALITAIGIDSGWKIENGRTRENIVLTLNDNTVTNIAPRTIGVMTCKELVANKCVLLADMLGPAVIWFAIVDADKTGASTKLTLPGLVDMQDGGDTGVLANGWMFRLATPTVRNCSVTTSHLRDFINRYAGKRSISTFDFKTDEIESVTCVAA